MFVSKVFFFIYVTRRDPVRMVRRRRKIQKMLYNCHPNRQRDKD
jgi:hypothetical protein